MTSYRLHCDFLCSATSTMEHSVLTITYASLDLDLLVLSYNIMLTELQGNWHLCSCGHFL